MNAPDFSYAFHQSSKDHSKNHPPIPRDEAEWPAEWRTTYYKAYPRLRKINLSRGHFTKNLFDIISERASRHDFQTAPITKSEISSLLAYSCGETTTLNGDRHRRAQPSGGARFPIEVYPFVFREGGDVPTGLYHYNVKDHALDILWEREFTGEEIDALFTYPWVKNAAVVFVMTAVFWRTQNKYGERGYRYTLLEAGHISQNMYLVASALGLKCCALGGTKDENIEKLLDIDGVTESTIYALAFGK